MRTAKLCVLFAAIFLPVAFALTWVFYSYIGLAPGGDCWSLSGFLIAPLIGYTFGRHFGDSGFDSTLISTLFLTQPLSLFVFFDSHDKYAILIALGGLAAPFSGTVASVFGVRVRAREHLKAGT